MCKDSFFRYTNGNFEEIGIGIEKNFVIGRSHPYVRRYGRSWEPFITTIRSFQFSHIWYYFWRRNFWEGLDPQKILVFELWRAECSKKEKIGFFGGRFSACSKYLVELVYINYESTCIGPTVAKKNKTKSVFVKKLKRNMTCQMPKN